MTNGFWICSSCGRQVAYGEAHTCSIGAYADINAASPHSLEERRVRALERIADALERIAQQGERHPLPF